MTPCNLVFGIQTTPFQNKKACNDAFASLHALPNYGLATRTLIIASKGEKVKAGVKIFSAHLEKSGKQRWGGKNWTDGDSFSGTTACPME